MGISLFVRSAAKSKQKNATIRLRLRDGKEINLFATTPLSVPLKYWNTEAKKNSDKIRNMNEFIDREWYKDQIEGLEKHVKTAYQQLQKEPTQKWLQESIDTFFCPKQEKKPVCLFEFIDGFIESSRNRINPKTGRKIAQSTLKKYTNCYHYLIEFSMYKKRSIDFEDIDVNFYNDFIKFLNKKVVNKGKDEQGNRIEEKGLAVNTIGKQIAILKGFMNEATDQGVNTFTGHKNKRFTVMTEEAETVYLDEKELNQLFTLDLSTNNRLDKVRDLFLVGCWTGCRYSDFSTITPEQVTNGFLHVQQEKTGIKVVIPLHPVVKSILTKYNGTLPASPSNQKFNDYIKEVCELAGIDETTCKTVTRGGRRVTSTLKKWELVSSHTARRSFATNLYKSGFPSISIMKITGHTTEKAFLKYIKVTPEEHAKLLEEHWKRINTPNT